MVVQTETTTVTPANDALIAQCRAAGMDLRYERIGECSDVGDATSIGIYRITQECLANIAKHAPRSEASVRLATAADRVHLSVRNTLPDGRPEVSEGGSGLPGMAARAEQIGAQLRAGVDGTEWLVDVVVPTGSALVNA